MAEKIIDVLVAAHKEKVIIEPIDIKLKDRIIEADLHAPDVYTIQEVQDLIYRKEYAKYCSEGLDKAPIIESEWLEEMEVYDAETRKDQEKSKPINSAEQGARKIARMKTVQEIIPRYLKDRKTGEFLFPDEESRKKFKVVICSDTFLMNQLAQAYLTIAQRIKKTGEQAKKSLTPASSGDSEKK